MASNKKPTRVARSSERLRGCFYCSKEGHVARECPQKEKDRLRKLQCYACGGDGHMKRNCPFLDLSAAEKPVTTRNAREYSRSVSSPPSNAVVTPRPRGGTRQRGWSENKGYRLGSASESTEISSVSGRSYSSVAIKKQGVDVQEVIDNLPKLEFSSNEREQSSHTTSRGKCGNGECSGESRKLSSQQDHSSQSDLELTTNLRTHPLSIGGTSSVKSDRERDLSRKQVDRSAEVKASNKEERSLVDVNHSLSRPGLEKRKLSHYPPFIDTHCHLEYVFERYHHRGSFSDFADRLRFPTNFEGCISTFCDPAAFSSLGSWTELLSEPNVWGAFGIHPHNAKYFHTSGLEDKLIEGLQHPKCVAFGEIGLDYSEHSPSDPKTQKDILRHQLQLVVPFGKPLILHCRDAEQDLFQILVDSLPRDWFIHLHCFTGEPRTATQFMEQFPNLYLGICGNVTNPQQVNMRTVASSVPLERLLIETDAPYHVPSNLPKAGWCRNSHPALAFYVAKEIANLRNMNLSTVLKIVRTNTRTLYGV